MRYAKRDSVLEGMPKKTAYQAAFGAQRRAIARVANKTLTQRTLTTPYTGQDCLSLAENEVQPTSD